MRHAQLPEEQKAREWKQEELARQRARLNELLQVVDARLASRGFLVAGHFTAAEVVMASILYLAHHLQLLGGHPRLVEYVKRHTQRPAVRRAVSA